MLQFRKRNCSVNWLAHIFLSEQNIDFQLGNYLADPLKARVWENASLDIKRGMKVHLLIDSFTDKHEIFVQSKKRLREKGLLKSIVVDIIYDFLLTKNWDTFCNIPFEDYTNQFYKDAEYQISSLPHKPSIYVESMVRNQILNKYKTLSHVKKLFKELTTDYQKNF